MSLETLLGWVENDRKRLVHYAGETDGEPLGGFEVRNADVVRRSLPSEEGFVVVRDDDTFLGAVPASRLQTLLEPPIGELADAADDQAGRTALFELLDNTLFASLNRRNLLVASREIEQFARRIGRGRLEVGFQRAAAFEAQRAIYARLVAETELDIHVHLGSVPAEPFDGVTFHTGDGAVDRFWFLVFDGDGDDERKRGLLARQRDDDSYSGFWTYNPDRVADIDAGVRADA